MPLWDNNAFPEDSLLHFSYLFERSGRLPWRSDFVSGDDHHDGTTSTWRPCEGLLAAQE